LYDTGWLSEQSPLADISGDYLVNMEDFSMFGAHWLQTNCTEHNNWCDGADLWPEIPDGVVDTLDLAAFAESWLAGVE
jgi:hypothetical protein